MLHTLLEPEEPEEKEFPAPWPALSWLLVFVLGGFFWFAILKIAIWAYAP